MLWSQGQVAWYGVVVPVRVPSRGQIDLFEIISIELEYLCNWEFFPIFDVCYFKCYFNVINLL